MRPLQKILVLVAGLIVSWILLVILYFVNAASPILSKILFLFIVFGLIMYDVVEGD